VKSLSATQILRIFASADKQNKRVAISNQGRTRNMSKKDSAINAVNRFSQFFGPIAAAVKDVQEIVEGGIEAEKELVALTDSKNRLAKEVAGLQREKSELVAALPSLRDQASAIRTELKQERETRAREAAEYEAIVKARQGKLEHLDRAIKNKAGELGAAIAQELV
jgi:chromosome segregation ATPase